MKTNRQVYKIKSISYDKVIPERILRLVPKLRAIYDTSFEVCDQIDWVKEYLSRGDINTLTILHLDGDIVGFSCSAVETVQRNGQIYAIFNACVYTELHQKVGLRLTLNGLSQALYYKILHPYHSVMYVTDATSPASYCLMAEVARRCFPSPSCLVPSYVEELFDIYARKRKAVRKKNNEYVVRFSYFRRLKKISKLKNSKKLMKSNFYEFYLSRNPHYSEGDTLLVAIPLDCLDIFIGLWNCIQKIIKNKKFSRFSKKKLVERSVSTFPSC